MKITLIITGSIAAYKSAELLRELVRRKHEVHVVMTAAAERFITSLTLQTLSGHPVTTDLFDEAREAEINHIRLADQADVVLVAPASANIIAKMAAGLADDAASTVLLATTAPIVIAPAMNVNMWQNTATVENIRTLQRRGVVLVPPDEGDLACGWQGAGRLAENAPILTAVESAGRRGDLSGVRIIVTAGPTREPIDPMRFVSNRSSGKTGFALARQARRRGAEVVLVTGPVALAAPPGVRHVSVETALELSAALRAALEVNGAPAEKRQILVMAAAVCDHRPEHPASAKLKQEKRAQYTLSLIPNEDILEGIGRDREAIERKSGLPLTLVGFAAETAAEDELLRSAAAKLEKKRLDFIIANSIAAAAERDETEVWILSRSGFRDKIGVAAKDEVADKILDAVTRI